MSTKNHGPQHALSANRLSVLGNNVPPSGLNSGPKSPSHASGKSKTSGNGKTGQMLTLDMVVPSGHSKEFKMDIQMESKAGSHRTSPALSKPQSNMAAGSIPRSAGGKSKGSPPPSAPGSKHGSKRGSKQGSKHIPSPTPLSAPISGGAPGSHSGSGSKHTPIGPSPSGAPPSSKPGSKPPSISRGFSGPGSARGSLSGFGPKSNTPSIVPSASGSLRSFSTQESSLPLSGTMSEAMTAASRSLGLSRSATPSARTPSASLASKVEPKVSSAVNKNKGDVDVTTEIALPCGQKVIIRVKAKRHCNCS